MNKKLKSRRKFIKNLASASAMAFGAPFIVPSTVFARKGSVPPSDRIVMGCIGLGGQGRYNMRAFINQPDTQIVALCDVDEGTSEFHKMNMYPDSQGGLRPALHETIKEYARQDRPISPDSISTYTDFRELLDRNDIDAVTVVTPDHWHGLITIAAAEAGKDIYCEKPLTNSIFEGRSVCNSITRYERILQTGSHERSNDSVRYAWELVHNGNIGELKEIHINMPNMDPHHKLLRTWTKPMPSMPVPKGFHYDFWLGPAPRAPYTRGRCHFWWRFILDYGGGEMTDRGAHIIDLAQFINGTDDTGPVELSGKGKPVGNGLYNAFIEYNFEAKYKNGVRLLGSSKGERGLKLVGSDGWIFIHIHGGRLEASDPALLKRIISGNEIHVERSPGHRRNFLDSIKTRHKTVAHEEIGHRTATICHLLNIAMLTGRKLEWDPVREQITNEPEINKMLFHPMRSPWSI